MACNALDIKISKPYLEGLTTHELINLAASFNIDIPYGLDRIFIIEELLEAIPCLQIYQHDKTLREEEKQYAVKSHLEMPSPSPLPQIYNKTYIDVVVRDPFWVFAIWEVSAVEHKKYEKVEGFSGYSLCVRCAEKSTGADTPFMYTANISGNDKSRYLHFPQETPCKKQCTARNCSFIVELCAFIKGEKEILIASYPFTLPRGLSCADDSVALNMPLLKLSGIEHLKIARSAI
ncbi:MAG: DUF4912 domain-containing protein [Spirochaetaceae bacterium]|jgi:hypothetical protein|nr:DUF4912 domain-containing protein [Spirochaetaceae bacterium]